MLLQGDEARPHRVDGDMRCTQVLPPLRLTHPLSGIAVPRIHLCLDTHCTWLAASLTNVAVQALDGLLHPLVRPSQREPSVGHARCTAQQHLCSPTGPDGDRTVH